MLELRPLLVVTGNIRVEGGKEVKSQQTESDVARGKEHFAVVRETTVTAHRRKADVIVTDFWRRLRTIRILNTPFGNLVSPESRDALNEILARADAKIAEFNRTAPESCRTFNCVIVEKLQGVRQAKTAGWIANHMKDPLVRAALDKLQNT